jgi:hypothetical protein
MCKPIAKPAAPLTTFACVTPDLTWCPCRRQFGAFGKAGCELYAVAPIPGCDGGRGYRVGKVEGGEVVSRYDCFLANEGGYDSCECPDFVYRGHKRPCKHLRALRQLDAAGLLDAPNPLAEMPEEPALPDVEDAELAAWVEAVAGRYAAGVAADRLTREPVEDAGEWIGDAERVVEWAA